MNLQTSNLNKNLPWVYMESEFGVLGVARKPMKYVVDLSKRKRIQKICIFLQGAQTTND